MSHNGPNIRATDEVTDAAGVNRLVLLMVEVPLPEAAPQSVRSVLDFHSLVWQVRDGDVCTERAVITRAQFEADARRRWPSALHSIDPAAGTAIIRVGEEQPPSPEWIEVEYSWREWDLIRNRQVRLLRVCEDPFEAL